MGPITSKVWKCIAQLYYQHADTLQTRYERIENAFESQRTRTELLIRHAFVVHVAYAFYPCTSRPGCVS